MLSSSPSELGLRSLPISSKRSESRTLQLSRMSILPKSRRSHPRCIRTESFRLRSIYKLLRGPRHATATNGSSSAPEPQQQSIFANAFEQLTLVAPETEPSSPGNPTPAEDDTLHATSEVLVEDTAGPTFTLKDDDLARDFELIHAISVSFICRTICIVE